MKDRRTITQVTAREAIEWMNVLVKRLGCAGSYDDDTEMCKPPNLCTACEARAWLKRRKLLAPGT
jgi:hypothetical protein